jgi:hypothetical protein
VLRVPEKRGSAMVMKAQAPLSMLVLEALLLLLALKQLVMVS